MKKVIYHQYGSIEQLKLTEVAMPEIKPNEILVKVRAVGINPLDWKIIKGEMKMMTGSQFPKGVSFEFSGIVEKVGAEANAFAKGDEVFGALHEFKGEALAEYVAVPQNNVTKKPAALSFENAAALTATGTAAMHMLKKAGVKSGDHILINGATGGVGFFATQMALKNNLKVTAVASGKGIPYLQKWGLSDIIDYRNKDVLKINQTYDAVLEISALLPFSKAKALMKSKSVFVSTLPTPKFLIGSFLNNLFSSKKHKIILARPTQDDLKALVQWVESGLEFETKSFPIKDFSQAYQYAMKGGNVGKVVITI